MLFILLFLLVSVLLDWYAFQGLKVLTANWKPGKRTVHLFYWFLLAGSTLSLGISFILTDASIDPLPPSTVWAVTIFITLFVTKLVFALILFGEDIWRFAATIFKVFLKNKKEKIHLSERRKFISQLGLLIVGIPFVSFIYGIAKGKYDYTLHRQTLFFDDLPEAFDGFTITQISDIHSGTFDSVNGVKKGIELAKAQQSDLFVFTGDLVNNLAGEITPWIPLFSQLKAPYGQFSIMGNHDYGEYVEWGSREEKLENIEKVKLQHKALDYRLLLDEHVSIQKDGQKIELIGVENWGTGFIQKGDLDKALHGTEEGAFKILLSHDPSHWEVKVKNHPQKIQLTLSGHTHGAQMGVETPTFKWSPVEFRYQHWAGLKTENERSIYINRGFGFLGFSSRVGIWPEITVIELRRKRA